MTGEHYVRGEEHMVMNDAVMTNVIARPHDDVVADGRERLEGVVLQNEAVVSDLRPRPNSSFGTDVANQFVSLGL